jgi:protein-S-isoprenylcysteine O-methyltransferase Ste14
MVLYRLARPAPAAWNLLKTLGMIVVFMMVCVWAIPKGIVSLQRESGQFDALFFPPQESLGLAVFAVATVLVLWAGLTLAVTGGGTPVSFDAPRRLVISGPYAWLRTPMVTGAFLQGMGLGLMEGSIVVILLFAVFALLWNSFVRPSEENHMQSIFGRDFELYRRSVRCWLPMRSAWRGPVGDVPPITLAETPDPGRRRRKGHR